MRRRPCCATIFAPPERKSPAADRFAEARRSGSFENHLALSANRGAPGVSVSRPPMAWVRLLDPRAAGEHLSAVARPDVVEIHAHRRPYSLPPPRQEPAHEAQSTLRPYHGRGGSRPEPIDVLRARVPGRRLRQAPGRRCQRSLHHHPLQCGAAAAGRRSRGGDRGRGGQGPGLRDTDHQRRHGHGHRGHEV